MKKASKPVPKTPAKKAPAPKPATAQPKAKPAAKSKPRATQDQLELFPILKRLALAAERLAVAPQPQITAQKEPADQGQVALLPIIERLAQETERLVQAADRLVRAAERLADAPVSNAQRREQPPDTFKTLSESIADSTAAEEHPQTAEPSDLAISGEHPERVEPPELTASGESAETVDNTQAEMTDNPHKNDE